MTESERINYIIDTFERGNAADFARKIKKSEPAVSKLRKGLYRFNSYADAIAKAYPQINCRWLLTGEGEPLMKNDRRIPSSKRIDDLIEKVDSILTLLQNQ